MRSKYLIWWFNKKPSQHFNRSFIVRVVLDIVENIVEKVVDQDPELIRCMLTTLSNKAGEGSVPLLPLLGRCG